MQHKLFAVLVSLALAATTAVFTAQGASAVTANVTISASAASNGTTTLTYGATSTAAGTVSYIDVTIPPGSGGSVTTLNGIVRTVAPGTLRWYPTKVVTVPIGARFSIPFYGLILPSGGPWQLSFKAVSTTGSLLSYGTGLLGESSVKISATNPIPGQTTNMYYTGYITTPGTLTKVVMQAPSGATGILSTINGKLTSKSGYITWTANSPIKVSAGTKVSIPLYNMTLSVYGGVQSLSMSAQTSTGGLLMSGKGSISLIAPPAAMPAVPITEIPPSPAGCPSSWPDTATENALPGSGQWVIGASELNSSLQAYLTKVSATCGDSVGLKVDSGKPVDVVAYRMGYYGGLGAREVWRQEDVPTVNQPAPTVGGTDANGNPLRMVSAKNWSTTLTVPIDATWVPGTYLIRITDGTYATYAPITIRDDTGTKHDFLIQQATTTWAAYNSWGGYSFYSPSSGGSSRLSFDRPYGGDGSGQYLQLEQGLAYWAESKGLDVTYWTDNDLDEFGGQVPNRADMMWLPGHDEYYTPTMRAALSQAINSGIDVASLGANTVYRRMWFTNDTRREWDIDRVTAGDSSTTWRYLGDAYASQPLLGAEYRCPLTGNTLTTGTSWLYEGIPAGTTIPGFIAGEIDRVDVNLYQYPGQEVVGSGTGICRSGSSSPMHITAFTAPSGARVFNGSTFAYGCFLVGRCATGWAVPSPSATSQKNVGIMMANILKWTSSGTVTLTQTEKTAVSSMKVKVPQRPLPMYEEEPPGLAKK